MMMRMRRLLFPLLALLIAIAPAGARLQVNHLSGFGSGGVVSTGAEIGSGVGSIISSDFSGGGGASAAFDGITNQVNTSCARSGSATLTGYIGKTFDVPRIISKGTIHGSNNAGYNNGGNPSETIYLYAKNGAAPSSGTDGTILGSISFTDTADERVGRDIDSNDLSTLWDHAWFYIVQGSSNGLNVAEARFFE